MLWKMWCLTLQSMGRTNHIFPIYTTRNVQINCTHYSLCCPSASEIIFIIRDGKSQIAEDGSLQLVEERDNTFFSGSGQTPPPATEGPTEKEERRRRASSSLLSPMDSALPTLPSSVEELVLTWQASAEVGRARARVGE